MYKDHAKYLICPDCHHDLKLDVQQAVGLQVESGNLQCEKCNNSFPIINFIPRFVDSENYASGFGYEWNIHSKTQYDSYLGSPISETRFFEETKWGHDLKGELLLEVGSGSGRFTEHAASTDAMVLSLDYSSAVEANYASNGNKENVLIVQGDLYKMPFRRESFDKVMCIGVIQHTPDVRKTFMELVTYLKEGAKLTVDVYWKRPFWKHCLLTRYWVRPITKRMNHELLYKLTSRYVKLMWPICGILNKLPKGRAIIWAMLIADYRGDFDLPDHIFREWAILDTFDILSPAFDQPQTVETLQSWFEEAGLKDIEVHLGYNGVEGRGIK